MATKTSKATNKAIQQDMGVLDAQKNQQIQQGMDAIHNNPSLTPAQRNQQIEQLHQSVNTQYQPMYEQIVSSYLEPAPKGQTVVNNPVAQVNKATNTHVAASTTPTQTTPTTTPTPTVDTSQPATVNTTPSAEVQKAEEAYNAFTPIDTQELFNKYMNQAQNARDSRIANAEANYKALMEAQNTDYGNKLADINNASDEALRQAYISSMLGQRNLASQLAGAGLSGGATETTLANAINNYMNNRNAAENTRNDNIRALGIANNASVAELLRNHMNNLGNIDTDYYNALGDYQKDINNMDFNLSEEERKMLYDALQNEKDRSQTVNITNANLLNDYLKMLNGNEQNQLDRDLDWQKVLNSNDQNELNRNLEKYLQSQKLDWQSGENALDRNFDWSKLLQNQSWQSSENDKDREFDWNKVLNANQQNDYDRALQQALQSQKLSYQGGGSGNGSASTSGATTNTTSAEEQVIKDILAGKTNVVNTGAASNTSGNFTSSIGQSATTSPEDYNAALTTAQGIWKNSGGNLRAVSNTLEKMVSDGMISNDDYDAILEAILSSN